MIRCCEVRVMRIAEAGQVIIRGDSDTATGGYSIKKAEHTPYQRVGMERVCRGPLQSPRGVDKPCGPWPEPGQVWRHKHGTGLETDLS